MYVTSLMWDDIDYKQNVIHVTKTAAFNEDGTATIGSPKSEAGKRDIPLNDTIRTRQADRAFYSACFEGHLCNTLYKQGGNPQILKTILDHNSLAMTINFAWIFACYWNGVNSNTKPDKFPNFIPQV